MVKYTITNGWDMGHAVYALIFGQASGQLYYIIVLLQLTLLTPWLVKNRRSWMYLITPLYLVIIYVFNYSLGRMPKLYNLYFFPWFAFYLLGMDCRAGVFDKIIKKAKWYWILIAVLSSEAEAFLTPSATIAYTQIKLSSFILTTVLALYLVGHEKDVKECVLSKFGDYSYGIFYCHVAIMIVIEKIVKVIGLDSIWIVNYLICFVVTAIVSYVLVKLIRKSVKNKKVLNTIGF